MLDLIKDYLSRQDPNQPHNPVTRLLVSGLTLFAYFVLYGFYGLVFTVLVYLGISWFGLSSKWVLAALAVAVLSALWKSLYAVADYWQNYGH